MPPTSDPRSDNPLLMTSGEAERSQKRVSMGEGCSLQADSEEDLRSQTSLISLSLPAV